MPVDLEPTSRCLIYTQELQTLVDKYMSLNDCDQKHSAAPNGFILFILMVSLSNNILETPIF